MVTVYNNVKERGIKMKFKKYIDGFLIMLTAVFVNVGTASAFMIGNEDMPESIKKIR